jgi:hypothetical protein
MSKLINKADEIANFIWDLDTDLKEMIKEIEKAKFDDVEEAQQFLEEIKDKLEDIYNQL